MLMTRHGSCHCGAVTFACEIDLAPDGERSPQLREGPWFASTLRCNCSFCRKTRMWKSHVPAQAFRLLQGADNLSHYRFGGNTIDHTFCRTCGVYAFVSASEAVMGGDFFCINIACLDDVTDEEYDAAPIRYENGRQDDWEHPPRVTGFM